MSEYANVVHELNEWSFVTILLCEEHIQFISILHYNLATSCNQVMQKEDSDVTNSALLHSRVLFLQSAFPCAELPSPEPRSPQSKRRGPRHCPPSAPASAAAAAYGCMQKLPGAGRQLAPRKWMPLAGKLRGTYLVDVVHQSLKSALSPPASVRTPALEI